MSLQWWWTSLNGWLSSIVRLIENYSICLFSHVLLCVFSLFSIHSLKFRFHGLISSSFLTPPPPILQVPTGCLQETFPYPLHANVPAVSVIDIFCIKGSDLESHLHIMGLISDVILKAQGCAQEGWARKTNDRFNKTVGLCSRIRTCTAAAGRVKASNFADFFYSFKQMESTGESKGKLKL